jgi:hypothetical protein
MKATIQVMKKWFVLLVLTMAAGCLYAQPARGKYRLTIEVTSHDLDGHGSDCTSYIQLSIFVSGVQRMVSEWNVNHVPENGAGPVYVGTYSEEFTNDKELTTIQIWGQKQFERGHCRTRLNEFKFDLASISDCYEEVLKFPVPESFETFAKVTVEPVPVDIYYYDRSDRIVTGGGKDLPSDHAITLRSDYGFQGNTYKWEYFHEGLTDWKPVPSNLYQPLGHTLTVKGNDLPGVNFVETLGRYGKPVYFRVRFGCGTPSDAINLTAMPSAPNMLSTTSVEPTCSYYRDGKVTIKFDRALYAGETITFTKNNLPYGPAVINTLASDNTYTLENFASLESGTISFTGKYGYATYTMDPQKHYKGYAVPLREPIVFNATVADVHCYGGKDGVINVTATGGTKNYTATLFDGATQLNTTTLTNITGNALRELPIGLYTIKINDSNGCVPEVVKSLDREMKQPEFPTVLTLIDSIEPLGYGLTNGYITVRSQDGTPNYTFAWTDGAGNPLTADAPVQEGVTMTSRLSNIGKGVYKVRANDSQLALVSPVTPTNTRGCYDTLTLHLYQPPLLEVALSEYHYVTCFDYADGEILAHATGGRPYLAGSPLPYRYEWFRLQDGAPVSIETTDSISVERPSAIYRVRVTDRNNIVAWSDDFQLVQPELLTIAFNTSQLKCNGDTNGTSVATVRGGTPGYEYAWSTEAETPAIENLTEGWYSLVVDDVRGCTTFGQTEVKVPNSLEAAATLVPPTCNGYGDGSVALALTGGVTPYRYDWGQGETTERLAGLQTGTYTVRVTDANNCFIIREYTLTDPALLAIDLGPDRVLCLDQTLPLDIAFNDPAPQYEWMKDGALYARTSAVDLKEPGTYVATVVDSKGCRNVDAINITRNGTVIAASIMVASRGPVGQKVRVANISYPFPERVEWIVPTSATVMEETPEYIDLSFTAKDTYTVGMISRVGDCEKVAYNQVKIVDPSELTDYKTPDEAFIRQFSVAPNPNKGRFVAQVELREASDFTLQVNTVQGTPVASQLFRYQSYAQAEFDLTGVAGPGVYVLQLLTKEGHATFKLVIQ